MISTLKAGDNLMYFPEGAWNMSPNLPMLPCFLGIIDVPKRGGADIIPVAIEQYGKHFKINIGSISISIIIMELLRVKQNAFYYFEIVWLLSNGKYGRLNRYIEQK